MMFSLFCVFMKHSKTFYSLWYDGCLPLDLISKSLVESCTKDLTYRQSYVCSILKVWVAYILIAFCRYQRKLYAVECYFVWIDCMSYFLPCCSWDVYPHRICFNDNTMQNGFQSYRCILLGYFTTFQHSVTSFKFIG